MQAVTTLTSKELSDMITLEVQNSVKDEFKRKTHELNNAEYMNKKDSAKYIGVSYNTLERLAREHNLPHYTVYTKIMYKRSDLNDMMSNLKEY